MLIVLRYLWFIIRLMVFRGFWVMLFFLFFHLIYFEEILIAHKVLPSLTMWFMLFIRFNCRGIDTRTRKFHKLKEQTEKHTPHPYNAHTHTHAHTLFLCNYSISVTLFDSCRMHQNSKRGWPGWCSCVCVLLSLLLRLFTLLPLMPWILRFAFYIYCTCCTFSYHLIDVENSFSIFFYFSLAVVSLSDEFACVCV